jgi:hypothetical protein
MEKNSFIDAWSESFDLVHRSRRFQHAQADTGIEGEKIGIARNWTTIDKRQFCYS